VKGKHKTLQELLDICEQVTQKKVSIDLYCHDYGVPLYLKELLTIKTIGKNPGINVTGVAKYLNVTRGAVSQTVAKLVTKKLVRKTYMENNAKEVVLELTERGREVFDTREKMLQGFIQMAQTDLGDEFQPQLELMISVLKTINTLLTDYATQIKTDSAVFTRVSE